MDCKKDCHRYLYHRNIFFVIGALFLTLAICGCRKKEIEQPKSVKSERVSWDEIEIKYPKPQEQMEKLKAYNEAIKKLASKDRLLKDMLLDADFNCVVGHLKDVSATDKSVLGENSRQLHDYLQKIHSLSYDETFKFLQTASQDKNIDLLCVSLSAMGSEAARSEAARLIGAIHDPKAVRPLVSSLSFIACNLLIKGGAEAQVIRKETRDVFVEAISESTGLVFPDYDPNSEEDTLVVIKRAEQWLKENKL